MQELGLNWEFRRRQELLLGSSHSPMPPEASPVVNEFLRVRTTLSSLIQQRMPREGPLYMCRENEQNNSWLTLNSSLIYLYLWHLAQHLHSAGAQYVSGGYLFPQ